jgi:DNA-binding NarL/FixJ family response regulator
MTETNKSIRILICDDHAIVRSGLVKLLEEEDWIYTVAEAENGEDMIRKNEAYRPDLILADISMPILSGIDAVKKIKKDYPNVKVLFLSMLYDEQYVYCAIKIGALGLVSKDVSKDELLYALREVSEGREYYGPLYDNKKVKDIIRKYDDNKNISFNAVGVQLTSREEEVLKYVSQGMMSEEISKIMNLGKRTVDKVRTDIMQNFNLKSLPALISFAVRYTESKKNSNTTIVF